MAKKMRDGNTAIETEPQDVVGDTITLMKSMGQPINLKLYTQLCEMYGNHQLHSNTPKTRFKGEPDKVQKMLGVEKIHKLINYSCKEQPGFKPINQLSEFEPRQPINPDDFGPICMEDINIISIDSVVALHDKSIKTVSASLNMFGAPKPEIKPDPYFSGYMNVDSQLVHLYLNLASGQGNDFFSVNSNNPDEFYIRVKEHSRNIYVIKYSALQEGLITLSDMDITINNRKNQSLRGSLTTNRKCLLDLRRIHNGKRYNAYVLGFDILTIEFEKARRVIQEAFKNHRLRYSPVDREQRNEMFLDLVEKRGTLKPNMGILFYHK